MEITTYKAEAQLPIKKYFSREEAATWLSVSVDTFMSLEIRYCDFGPRTKRWDIVDIIYYAEHTKSCDSARTSAQKIMRRRQLCVSIKEKAPRIGGSTGMTRVESDIAEVLEL